MWFIFYKRNFKRRRTKKGTGTSNAFFEISARDDSGIKECYEYIIDDIINVNLDNTYKKFETIPQRKKFFSKK